MNPTKISSPSHWATVVPAPSAVDATRVSNRWQVSTGTGFWIVAAAFLTAMTNATIQTPLFTIYQHRLGFPTFTLTLIFAVFAVGVLAGLWLIGHISDIYGRRPLVLAGVALQIVSGIVAVVWPTIPGLFVCRFISGFGVGALTAAATAYLVELQAIQHPEGNGQNTANAVGTVANVGGLGVGALVAGFLATYFWDPLVVPYVVLMVLLLATGIGVLLVQETVSRPAVRPRYHLQRISVPSAARSAFVAASAAAFSSFALFGLFNSLAPSFLAGTLHNTSLFAAGAITFSVFAAASITQVIFTSWSRRRQIVVGVIGVVLGLIAISAGVLAVSQSIYVVGGICAGGGNGLLFGQGIRTAGSLGDGANRSEVLAAFFIAAYAGLTIPVVVIGALLEEISPQTTLIGFSVVTAILAMLSGAALLRLRTRDV